MISAGGRRGDDTASGGGPPVCGSDGRRREARPLQSGAPTACALQPREVPVTGATVAPAEPRSVRPPLWVRPRLTASLSAAVLLTFGLGLRLLDLTDPPLDFDAWRQLRSAVIARGLYYEWSLEADAVLRGKAVELAHFGPLEPTIAEHVVALTYLALGGEHLWVARVYSSLAWVIGGLGVWALVTRILSPGAALISLGFCLFLPFAVIAGRSFQPDPYMVMWMTLAAWALFRWRETDACRWAAAAGLLAGMAILTKVFAFFPLAAAALGLLWVNPGLRRAVTSPQAWLVAGLAGALPAWYYFFCIPGEASGYLSGWVTAFSNLLLSPMFYVRWAAALQRTMGLPFVVAGLVGAVMMPRAARGLVIGLWVGYGLVGFSVPSLIISHSYYQLPLVPIVSVSLGALAHQVLACPPLRKPGWKALGWGVVVAGALYGGWSSARVLLAEDYRLEPIIWQRVGESLPKDGKIIGLTHDYNTRLRYYGWTDVAQWPHATDLQMGVLAGGNYDPEDPAIAAEFVRRTQGYSYFLVTLFSELDAQPVLRQVLSRYPSREGDGYVLYDLRQRP